MTLRIEILEQPERKRFWGEVEVGGMIARRREVTSPADDGVDGILAVVRAVYNEMVPKPKPAVSDVPAKPEEPPASSAKLDEDSDLDALRAEAEAAGVRVDGRWGETRLRVEIAAAGHEKADEPAPASD